MAQRRPPRLVRDPGAPEGRTMRRHPKAPAALSALGVAAAAALAGPSPDRGFSTIINIPQDMPSISGGIGSDTQLNLSDGGEILSPFNAGPADGSGVNVEVNILGGLVGPFFQAESGSTINISGGSIGSDFRANFGSTVRVSGGWFGEGLYADNGSTIEFLGGEFQLNGAPVTEFYGLERGDHFTGTLADGAVFIFADAVFNDTEPDRFPFWTNTLTMVALEPADTTPMIVTTGPGPDAGLRAGQSLTLGGDATLRDNFAAVGATLNLDGGSVGDGLEIASTEVNLSGGSIGDAFRAYEGSVVTVSGGTIGEEFKAFDGATVSILGGEVGEDFVASGATVEILGGTLRWGFRARDGATVDILGGSMSGDVDIDDGSTARISGGAFGRGFWVDDESTVHVSGGSFGDGFDAEPGSVLEFSGGEFMLNGAPISDLPAGLAPGDLFTGTLADGTTFLFAHVEHPFYGIVMDAIETAVTLHPVALEPPDTTPTTVLTGPGPTEGLRAGQTLTLGGDATLRNYFAAIGATLNIEGGTAGWGLEVASSEVDISGGSVVGGFRAFDGSHVTISGGSVGRDLRAYSGSEVTISDGSIDYGFEAHDGATVNILGGSVDYGFEAHDQTTVNILGGSVGNGFLAYIGSTVNISGGSVGREFGAYRSTVNISGGSVGSKFGANSGSTVAISGGSFDGPFTAAYGSVVTISGGSFGERFRAKDGAEVRLIGTSFFADGYPIGGLVPGEPYDVFFRGVTLSGSLADGSGFTIDLNHEDDGESDFVDLGATLTITLLPGPPCPGDLDGNGVVDVFDFAILADWFGAGPGATPDQGDLTGDGWIDAFDFAILAADFGCET
jgi:hypothetical protein